MRRGKKKRIRRGKSNISEEPYLKSESYIRRGKGGALEKIEVALVESHMRRVKEDHIQRNINCIGRKPH